MNTFSPSNQSALHRYFSIERNLVVYLLLFLGY